MTVQDYGIKMTNQEINRKLALAIGYHEEDISFSSFTPTMFVLCDYKEDFNGPIWREFDFMDWKVSGPIAERFDCFPKQFGRFWVSTWPHQYETPQLAIAMAVIAKEVK